MPKSKLFFVLLLLVVIVFTVVGCGKTANKTEDKFSGDWVCVSPYAEAKVYKNGDTYIWEQEGQKIPAYIQDGLLRMTTGRGEVVVTYEEKTGNLLAVAQGNQFTYVRKEKYMNSEKNKKD